MDQTERKRRVEETLRQLQLIAGGMAAAVLAVAGIAFFFRSQGGPGPPPVADTSLAWVLVTLGFALLILAPFATRALLGRAVEGSREAATGEAQLRKVVDRFRAANLVGFALREAGGLLGGVTALITGEPVAGYVLAGAAVFMMFRAWPRQDVLEALLGRWA